MTDGDDTPSDGVTIASHRAFTIVHHIFRSSGTCKQAGIHHRQEFTLNPTLPVYHIAGPGLESNV